MRVKKYPFVFLFSLLLFGCSIVGVHFKFHNPHRAGKYPKPTAKLTLLGNQDSKYRRCFDVEEYNIDVVFKSLDKDGLISGSVYTWADVVTASDTFQFDIGDNLTVDSVYANYGNEETYNSPWEPHKFTRVGNTLYVIYEQEVENDYSVGVRIYYHGCPPEAKRAPWRGGFVRKKDNLDNPWWGVACQSEGASMWWPCKDVVNDEPNRCYISYSVPKGFVAVGNGVLKESDIAPFDSTLTKYEWRTTYPINLYNITFYIGKYKLLHDTYTSKVTGDTLALNHYVLDQHYDQAKEHFKQLKDHLAFYEDVFGPYPFYRDGFKLVESPYAGMEHQTAIAYGNKFKNNSYGFDYIILHETAHEWWGNSLTAYDLAEGWLHEGFATYAECLYVERIKGYNAYLQYLKNYKWTIVNRRPLVGVYGIRYFNYKDGDIYTKGAWVLHTLRTTINNDSTFFDIIKTFATRYMYRNVTTKDFVAVVNEKTGEDYNWFFNQYAYNRFVPELEYYKRGSNFYFRWNPEYVNSDFQLPVTLGGVQAGKTNAVVPGKDIICLSTDNDEEPYLINSLLVKLTENKKLRKLYQIQKGD